MVQQSYYKIQGKEINLSLVKYNKDFAQIIDANVINKNILSLYSSINNVITNNWKIVWDLCLLFYFFGNDHLPSSIDIGPELGMEYFLKLHHNVLKKDNIVTIKKSNIKIDINNLLLVLDEMAKKQEQNQCKIILQRYFKISNNLINLFIDKLNLSWNRLLEFLKIYSEKENIESRLLEFGFNQEQIKLINLSENLFIENLDFDDELYNGLILYNKPINVSKDHYQDLYNYITEKTVIDTTNKYSSLNMYDFKDLNEHLSIINNSNYDEQMIYDYLKKLFHLSTSMFGNISEYHTNNITVYSYNYVPSISDIVKWIRKYNIDNEPVKNWIKDINSDNLNTENYFNHMNHYFIITPYIHKFLNITNLSMDNINYNNEQIINIINEFEPIDNLWFNDKQLFSYRKLEPKLFLIKWFETINRLKDKNNSVNNEIIQI